MAFPKFQTKEVLNKVLNSAETALQVDIVSGAEYAEDSAHTSADTGNFILGVRNDTLAALGGADGDYVPFQMNASGALYVEISSGGSSDAVYVDDADWSDGSSKHMLVGGLYQSTPQSITDGDVGPLQVNANGNLIVDLSATDNAVLDAIAASLSVLDDWDDSDYANVNMNLAGSDAQAGEGTISATTQRVTIATDDDGVAHLATIAGAVSTQMQVDVVAALPAGDNNIGNVDIASSVGLTVDLGSNNDVRIESGQIKSGAIASGAVASGALASGSVSDGAMVTLGAKADAKSTATDTTSITAMQVLKQISASVQEVATDTGTIDSDTDATKTATEASQAALEKMLYGNALVVTAVDGGSTQALGATYESLYVGVGGNVVVTMVGTGNFTFSNVASGQLLPIRITHVINTGTTATNMIALKA